MLVLLADNMHLVLLQLNQLEAARYTAVAVVNMHLVEVELLVGNTARHTIIVSNLEDIVDTVDH